MAQIISEKWGEKDGKEVFQYTLTNSSGVEVKIINYGGTITCINTPDRHNIFRNITLAFTSLEGYLQQGNPCFGCIVGRFANRIAAGRFTLGGKVYTLAKNNNGNSLHGGLKGFDKVVWDAEPLADRNGLKLNYTSKDGEEGFPGTLTVSVEYRLMDDNAMAIEYRAVTDAPTPVNLTNHAYFNLSGGIDDSILEHELQLSAESYTDSNEALIPTGEIIPVADTPLDFRKSKKVGKDIAAIAPGYDHNFVLKNKSGELQQIGMLYHPGSG
ncbi:MAG: galactose mutarotase, partial [Bacteroidetes bacterium]|nr:galactose mutarotase [Bacteroidota bacterium]